MDVSKSLTFVKKETTVEKRDASVAGSLKESFSINDSTGTFDDDDDNSDLTEWRGLGAVFKSQFSRKMIFFRFRETPDQFVKCRWPINPYLFLIYRLLFMICIVGYTTLSATEFYLPAEDGDWKWPLYLTSWLELISSIYSITVVVCYVKYYFIPFWRPGKRVHPRRKSTKERNSKRRSRSRKPSTPSVKTKSFVTNSDSSTDTEKPSPDKKPHHCKKRKLPLALKLCWHLYNASVFYWLVRAIIVLFIGSFATVIRPDGLKLVELVYCFLLAVELFMVSIPVHILHAWVMMLNGLLYLSFSAIYLAVGGTGRNGQPYIMKPIDYKNNPLRSGFISAIILVSAPLALQILGFIMTCFRDWLYYKLCK